MENLWPKKIESLKQRFNAAANTGMPMGFRLFLFLTMLTIIILLGVIAILLLTGTFTAGLTESEKLVENELLHASQKISQQYGKLSAQAIEFSKELSYDIETRSKQLGIPVVDLPNHPELLEDIVSKQFDLTYLSLQTSKSSGAFFILNATVNPRLNNAANSKAGLYLKNMEPNIISSSAPSIIVLRGFPGISRNNSLSLHTQWRMEFDVSDALYYHRPVEVARQYPQLPLSRLYYWNAIQTLPGTSEEAMLCSVPLIDSQGNVFGVCGFEVSSLFFKLSHLPNNSIYNRLFCVLAPWSDSALDLQQAMVAGGYSARAISKNRSPLTVSQNSRLFYSYRQDKSSAYWGLHAPIRLYPDGSAFAEEKWVAAVMIPEEDVVNSVARLNMLLLSLLTLLVLLGIAASFVISKRYLKPISQGLEIIKSSDFSEAPKTKIPEIDSLIEYLATRNQELYEGARQKNLSFSILDEFVRNSDKLSPAERSVFNLYAQGHAAKEIAEILHLSINTIKTHSKNIYAKLNISSREELLLYVNLLDEIGKHNGVNESTYI